MAHWLLILPFLSCLSVVLGNNPTVRITSTDPPVSSTDGFIVQQRGKDALLTCVVEDKPITSLVQWTVSNRAKNISNLLVASATKTEDVFRWSIDTPSATSWRLRIQNVQESDEGVYTCKVEVVSHNDVDDSRMLRVVEKPQIKDLDTSTDMTKNTGDSATLECHATGRPQPTIRWTRLAGELLPKGGSMVQANVLYIGNVRSDDAGYYKCTASNFAGSDERLILLTVLFRPEVETSEPVVKQKPGYVKQLVCNIKGYPLPTSNQIGWKKEGISIMADNRVKIRNIVGAYNRITSIVDIRGVRASDFGRYQCTAENEKGAHYTYIDLMASPVPTKDRSYRIVSGVSMVLVNLGLTVFMVLFTCLLQRL